MDDSSSSLNEGLVFGLSSHQLLHASTLFHSQCNEISSQFQLLLDCSPHTPRLWMGFKNTILFCIFDFIYFFFQKPPRLQKYYVFNGIFISSIIPLPVPYSSMINICKYYSSTNCKQKHISENQISNKNHVESTQIVTIHNQKDACLENSISYGGPSINKSFSSTYDRRSRQEINYPIFLQRE